jgi:hypothetical protein
MMTSVFAYPEEVLKPVPTKIYIASFFAKGDVDPIFYDTIEKDVFGWVKYVKAYNSMDDVKFPVGAVFLQVAWDEAQDTYMWSTSV